MMWILVWMQLVTSQGVEHYQLGTFTKEADCQESLAKAVVLVNNSSVMLSCLEVDTRQ